MFHLDALVELNFDTAICICKIIFLDPESEATLHPEHYLLLFQPTSSTFVRNFFLKTYAKKNICDESMKKKLFYSQFRDWKNIKLPFSWVISHRQHE